MRDYLRKYHGEIILHVCSMCSDIKGWDKRINKILECEYPQWINRDKGIPGNDPVWDKFGELWEEHEVQCLVFSYDDWSFAVCRDHLIKLIELI
jgi:hypothetical protein